MATTLPSNLHAELALDRGRLSREGPERSASPSIAHVSGTNSHVRVQSLHGVVVENAQFCPDERHGAIMEEEPPSPGILSGAELAAALDQEAEDDEDDEEVIRYPQNQNHIQATEQRSHFLPPRSASLNVPAPQHQQPKGILPIRSETLTPPPRSSSCRQPPASAPPQERAFPDKPRFQLTDDGPISAPPTPPDSEHGHCGQPGIRRAVSDSHPHAHSAPNSPGLGVTPPMRRGTARTQPGTPTKYNTFEEMGIQAKTAESDKDCVIM